MLKAQCIMLSMMALVFGLWAYAAVAWNQHSEACFEGAKAPAETLEACSKALSSSDVSDAERGRLLYRRGLMSIEIEDYQSAAADFDDAIRYSPDDEAEVLAARGAAHRYLGRSEQAIADYVRSIDLDKSEITTYRSLASLLQGLERHREALHTLTGALDHDTENPYVYRDRGRLHIELGNYQEAIADLNRAILIKRDYLGPWRDRAVVYERQGRTSEAITEYNKVLDRKPGDRLSKRALAGLEIEAPAPEPKSKPEPSQRIVEPRVALVVGNSAYRGRLITKLSNPSHDATDLGASLERTGFDVT
ncbi:MAG: tetratricopeptide repeat protein, partial [Geminicoccaceae bacterium]